MLLEKLNVWGQVADNLSKMAETLTHGTGIILRTVLPLLPVQKLNSHKN